MTAIVLSVASSISATDLQRMIDTAPPGATLKLEAGTFQLDRTIIIDREDISIEGAGAGETIFEMAPRFVGETAIQIGHGLYDEWSVADTGLATSAKAGDTRIELSKDINFQPGDIIYIEQENTDAYFDEIGDTQWQKDTPLKKFMAEVVSVTGNTVELSAPLPFDYDKSLSSVEMRDLVDGVHLSGFSIIGSDTVADPGDFSNTMPAGERSTVLLLAGAGDTALSDIEIINPVSHGVTIDDSFDVKIDSLSVEGAHNKGPGGNGYGVWIRDVFGSEFSDLTIIDTRHAVVFGSYNTATDNYVHVAGTNRDINFHGGRDMRNTVEIDSSVRTGEEVEYMSPTVFFNEGTRYGAPTDRDANEVTFQEAVGTVRGEMVHASDAGSDISTLGAADTIVGGDGNDRLDAGTGGDQVVASGGYDLIDGGSGSDRITFEGNLSNYDISFGPDGVLVSRDGSTTFVENVETLVFGGRSYHIDDLAERQAAERKLEIAEDQPGWFRAHVDGSAEMGEGLEAIAYSGRADVELRGNDDRNHIMGGRGDDTLSGNDGNDRLVGRQGDDLIFGGRGNDQLLGSSGNDILAGGEGADTLSGGLGEDLFVISDTVDIITDFSAEDTLIFEGRSLDLNKAVDALLSGQGVSNLISVQETDDGLRIGTSDGEQSVLLAGFEADAFF